MTAPTTPTAAPQQWTIGKLLDLSTQFLQSKNIPLPRLESEILLSHILAWKRIELYMHIDDPVGDIDRATLRDLVKRRSDKCPSAYLVGFKEFHSLRFKVNESTLIPRPETELLVDQAVAFLKDRPEARFIDIGTGSGIVAVCVAHLVTGSSGIAVDISSKALATAKENATTHKVADRLNFQEGNLFDQVSKTEQFDLIVSNPPYIPTGDLKSLESDVRDYEPALALDGGADGLKVIRLLVSQAAAHLKQGGQLLFEIGAGQSSAAEELVNSEPALELIGTTNDLAGIPRVVATVKK